MTVVGTPSMSHEGSKCTSKHYPSVWVATCLVGTLVSEHDMRPALSAWIASAHWPKNRMHVQLRSCFPHCSAWWGTRELQISRRGRRQQHFVTPTSSEHDLKNRSLLRWDQFCRAQHRRHDITCGMCPAMLGSGCPQH